MANGKPVESRFVFHGNAIPVGGMISRIGDDETPQALTSPPASSLTVTGGMCHATSPGSLFRDIFSWGQCVAISQGESRPDGSHVTTVTASVQDVSAANGPNVFKAGQIRITMVSTHPKVGQPCVTPTEVVFGGTAGMSLNGQKITVTTDLDDFRSFCTLEKFEAEFQKSKAFYNKYKNRFLSSQAALPAFGQPIPRVSGGNVVCSIVSSIQWGKKTIQGNVLPYTGFGKIYFGEVIINEYNRRLTMVRLAMGSDVGADVAFAESDPNGSWMP